MLLTKAARAGYYNSSRHVRTVVAHRTPRTCHQNRTFLSSAVQTLSNEFLDLAVALPYPSTFPVYSSTIIFVTVLSRLVWTAPFSYWALKRRWRFEENVKPELKKVGPLIQENVLLEMRKSGARGTEQELKGAFARKTRQLISQRTKDLTRQHRCSPVPTMMIPVLSQAPLFVGLSWVFGAVAQGASPLESESFLTLTSLTHVDPTASLPIALGVISLANVETAGWLLPEAFSQQPTPAKKGKGKDEMERARALKPKDIIHSALRVLSVVRILLGALVPGSVILYWVTSAAFGIVQSWVFDYLHLRRRRNFPITNTSSSPSPESPRTATPSSSRPLNPQSENRVFRRPR